MRQRILAVVAAAGLLLSLAPTVVAASPVTFGTPTASSKFGTGIDLSQPVTVTAPIGRVELLLTIADAIGPTVTEIPNPPVVGADRLTYTLDTSGNAHMIPNTPIVARWRLTSANDPTQVSLGPEVRIVYADDRFAWQTVSGAVVRVHWYQGDATFGAKALKLGEDEVKATSKLLGVTETQPIDFFVYADQTSFYDALGPGTHENVAGTAFADIRTLLGLIPPDQIDDPQVAVRIPHEFVHLVFDTAAKNPTTSRRAGSTRASRSTRARVTGRRIAGWSRTRRGSGTLIPLDGLTGEFPNGQAFFLAYAESVSAVDFMIRTYGSDALVSLIRSYANGRTDDEAFKAALGLDMTAFGKAWFDANNAKAPTKYGPQAPVPGPVPSAWTGGAIPGSTAAPAAGAAAPSGVASASPTAPPTTAAAGAGSPVVVGLAVIVLVLVVAGVVVANRRRRTPGELP